MRLFQSRRKASPQESLLLSSQPPAPSAEGSRPISGFFFYAALLALGGAGALGCFFTGFSLAPDVLPMLLAGLGCIVFCAVCFLLDRWKWWVSLAGLLVWALLVRFHYDVLVQGSIRTVNAVLAAYSEHLNASLPTFALPAGPVSDRQYSMTLFGVFLLFPFYWFLAWALQGKGSAVGAFCVTGLLLLLPLGFSILPAVWALGALFTFWGFLLFAEPSLHRRESREERGRVELPGSNFLRWQSLALLPLLALVLYLGYRLYPPEEYTRPQVAVEARDRINEATDLPALFRGEGHGTVDRVDLTGLGSRSFTGETVLRTRHQWPEGRPDSSQPFNIQKDYLKSFVGSVYTGHSWERLSEEQNEAAAQALGDQHAQSLPAVLSAALPGWGEPNWPYTLSVEKVSLDSRTVFSPYGLSENGGDLDRMAFEEDAFLRASGWFTRLPSYRLNAVAQPDGGQWLLFRYADSYASSLGLSYQDRLESSNEEYAQMTSNLLEDFNAFEAATGEDALDRYTLPRWAINTYAGNDLRALEAVQRYTAFVYETYTQLPEDTRAVVQAWAAKNGLSRPSAAQRFSYAQQVRDLLRTQCSYDLSPSVPAQDEDFVVHFLSDGGRRGYCVHFATAAVALLRAAGIPARYAEGYAVPVDSDGGWVNVPDRNAHAWVEIYWGGTGWLPFEVTPPGPDAPAAYRNAVFPSPGEFTFRGAQSSPAPLPTPEAPENPVENPRQTPHPTLAPVAPPQRPASGLPLLLGVLRNLALALSPLVLIRLQRLVRLQLRKRRFSQANRNRAALAVYAHLLKLYEQNNLHLTNQFEVPARAEELALRARYSQHTITARQLEELLTLSTGMERRLDQRLSKWERRWCRYGLALF